MVKNFNNWILATRPKTLSASVGPVVLGAAIAFYEGSVIRYTIFFLTLLTAVLLQIGTNLVNDYYDNKKGIDDESRLGPTRVTQSGLIEPASVKRAFCIVFLVAFLLGIYLMITGGLPIIVTGLLSILFAYAYTGGPLPLSYFALGEILALIFFGPVPVWGTTYLLTGESSELAILAGFGPGLIAAGIMSINNLRDIESDSKTTKKTIAVLVGPKGARLLTLLLICASSFIPFIIASNTNKYWAAMATITTYLFIKTWGQIASAPIDQKLNNALANTGKYLLLFCLVLSIGLNL